MEWMYFPSTDGAYLSLSKRWWSSTYSSIRSAAKSEMIESLYAKQFEMNTN